MNSKFLQFQEAVNADPDNGEVILELEPVERKERWYLWEVEDRVAQRVTPVFCAPSMMAIEKQYADLLAKHNAKPSELVKKVIAVYDQGKFLMMED